MNLKTLCVLACCLVTSIPLVCQTSPVDYADPLVGTSNSRWMLGPYACVPFGMVQLGPDNQTAGWMSGYEYSVSNVSGFSHLHAWTMGGLMIIPAGNLSTKQRMLRD
jgi:putative alpha-1,2-mannosidase